MKKSNFKSLVEIILSIKNEYGDNIIEDAPRFNALLMDYAPSMDKERKLVVNAIKEGAVSVISRNINNDQDNLEEAIRRCSALLASEMWITEKAAMYATRVVAASMGFEITEISSQSDEKPGPNSIEKQLIKGDLSYGNIVTAEELKPYSSIGYKAFASNKQITEIIIPQNIKKIYPKAFIDCCSLRSVSMTDSIELIGKNAFDGCTSLEHLDIGNNSRYQVSKGCLIDKKTKELIRCVNNKMDRVEVVNGICRINKKAFERSNIEYVLFPRTVELIQAESLYLTMSLKKIDIDRGNNNYKSCDGVLYSRDGKRLVRYPQGKNDVFYCLEDDVRIIERKAFSASVNLQSISFSGGLREIGENAFEYCTGIENLMLPRSVEIIGERAFQYCTGLKSVMLPHGIRTIGDCAFLECDSLKSVSVPKSVEVIGNMAFSGCRALSTVVIQDNVKKIGDKAFDKCANVEIEVRNNQYVFDYCRAHKIKCK